MTSNRFSSVWMIIKLQARMVTLLHSLKKAWNIVEADFCSAVKDFFALGELLK
jgi:hypothetical protein